MCVRGLAATDAAVLSDCFNHRDFSLILSRGVLEVVVLLAAICWEGGIVAAVNTCLEQSATAFVLFFDGE